MLIMKITTKSSNRATAVSNSTIRRLHIGIIGVVAFFMGSLLHDRPTLLAAGEPALTVAVMDLDNNTGDETLSCLRARFRDMMMTDLSQVGALKLVERARLQDVMKELRIGQEKDFDPNTVAKVGRLTGAQMLLVGSYMGTKDKARVDARLIDVETGSVLLAEKSEGVAGDDSRNPRTGYYGERRPVI